jgi:FAD:protein FMN transferase
VLIKIKIHGFLIILIGLLSACNNDMEQRRHDYPYMSVGLTMGTSYNIKASHLPQNIAPKEITHQIIELLDKVNGRMSTYQKDSELSLFNQSKSTDWLPVSPELYEVIKESLKISQLTKGLFDVTVGPLVNLWGFGPEEIKANRPDDATIKERLNQVGYHRLMLKKDGQYVKKDIPELYVDLSGIAKGYGVDQVANLLEHLNIMDYMVEIGGEIRVKGKNKDGQAWQIAVEKPTSEKRMVERILGLTDTGMATSGDYRNYFEENGVRFSHTIDPRTGRPIKHTLASVTVLSETSMEADGLATAFMVMGPEQGYQFAEQNHIAAFFIIKSNDGFDERISTAFINSTKVTR